MRYLATAQNFHTGDNKIIQIGTISLTLARDLLHFLRIFLLKFWKQSSF